MSIEMTFDTIHIMSKMSDAWIEAWDTEEYGRIEGMRDILKSIIGTEKSLELMRESRLMALKQRKKTGLPPYL